MVLVLNANVLSSIPSPTPASDALPWCSNPKITNSNSKQLDYWITASGAQFGFYATPGQDGEYRVAFFNGSKSPVYMAQEDFTTNKTGFVTLGVNVSPKYLGPWTSTTFSFSYHSFSAAGGSQC